jgi:hypothetical protein
MCRGYVCTTHRATRDALRLTSLGVGDVMVMMTTYEGVGGRG